MRRQSTAAIIALAMALAQSGPVDAAAADDPRNAATWYRTAFERAGVISDAEFEIIETYRMQPSTAPSPEVRAVLAKVEAALVSARRGSARGYCDYELDFSQGLELMLPHLSPARRIAKLMEADALVRLHDGDGNGAAELVAAMYRMAGHCGQDGTAISSLVARAIFKLAEEVAVAGFDREAFAQDEVAALLRAARELDPGDPFDMMESIIGEREMVVPWLRERGGEEDRLRLSEMIGLPADDPRVAELGALDDEAFAEEIDRYDAYMDQVVGAFMMEDTEEARAQLARLTGELEQGEHGLLAMLMAPALTKLYDVLLETRRDLQARVAMLEALIQGEVRPRELANAAFQYAAAIAAIRELEAEQIERARLVAAGKAEIDDALRGELIAAERAIATARDGSRLERCDFSVVRTRGLLELCPDYVAGMHDLLRVIHADAVRLLASGSIDDGVDRLVLIVRAVGHLSGDEPILSALVAHTAFDRAATRIGAGIEAGDLSTHHRELLQGAIGHVPRKDPFGWIGALAAGRAALLELRPSAAPEGKGPAQAARMQETIEPANVTEMLCIVAVFDAVWRRMALDANAPVPPDPIRGLGDIVSLDAIDALRATAPELAPKLDSHQYDFVRGVTIPKIAPVADLAAHARRDLRRATALLRVEVEEAPKPE